MLSARAQLCYLQQNRVFSEIQPSRNTSPHSDDPGVHHHQNRAASAPVKAQPQPCVKLQTSQQTQIIPETPQQSEKRATCVLIQSETETGFSCERVLKRTHRTELSLTNISTCLCSFVKVTHSADSVVMESRTEASCHTKEPNRTSSGSRDRPNRDNQPPQLNSAAAGARTHAAASVGGASASPSSDINDEKSKYYYLFTLKLCSFVIIIKLKLLYLRCRSEVCDQYDFLCF